MPYSEPCQYSTKLIEKLKSLDVANQLDFDLINKAICWSKKYHDGQMRKSGEPFFTHPLEVAYMIADYNLKTEVIVASILHDIVEDTEVTAGMILDAFGRRVEEMVDRLTRVRPDGSKWTVEELLNNAYKKNDKEVLLIKLFDRLHNIQTLESMNPHKQQEIARETLRQFVVLSIYIGDIKLERIISRICHQFSSKPEKIKKIAYFYDFLSKDDSYQLPALTL